MLYSSTRSATGPFVQSAEAIKRGLAPDGGLYMPGEIPTLSDAELEEMASLSYPERAARILGKFLTDYAEEASATKSQFLSAEIAMIVSFMPVFLLSGFLYEIENMPRALQIVTLFLPARWFVEFLQTILLVGDVRTVLLRDLAALAAFTPFFLAVARFLNPKKGTLK